MDIYKDETEFTQIHMFQRVVDMFENNPRMQHIVRLGLLANMGYGDELDFPDEDDYDYDNWVHNNSHGFPRSSDRGLSGNQTRSSGSAYQLPLHYYSAVHDLPLQPSVKVQAKESDTERRARLLQEAKKSKEKAEKKRLKKQKQKERKRLEKMEKEKQSPRKNEEEKDDEQESKAEKSKAVNDKSNSSVKEMAAAKDTDSSDSSEDESSDEDDTSTKNDSCNSEDELDMTSTFVTKAALIARRKLEKKPKPERKEKKKAPVKEAPETTPDKPNKDPRVEKKDSAAPSSAIFEDNLKISTDLATLGNQCASVGDYSTAVKYFTDAIKYNPTEFKLFGNRSFCFEKMQEYVKALADAELSLSMCPGWVKGMFRKGRALAGLKRYEEAAEAFREVLKLNSSCAEAAQELMRVQITQLMGYGFTREQSSNALIIHGTVEKAVEVLSKLNPRSGAVLNGVRPLAQVANVSGVSPVLSANTNPAAAPPQSQDALKTPLMNKPLGPVQNMSNVKTQPKPHPNQVMKTTYEDSQPPQELFPVWVGNLFCPVNETMITNLFSKVGNVYSVKVLTYKRCAFVNFTKQEYCEEAIRRFNGFELNGIKIAVRYPDRIPRGMGISKSALKADDLQDENVGQSDYGDGRNAAGSRRPARPYRPVPDHRGNYKY